MANIITTLSLEMSSNWYVSKKLNSIGRVGENTVTKLIIEPTEILDDVTYEIEIMSADGSKNVAELTIDGTELYLILTANMLTTSGITKMQVRAVFEDGSIKKSNIFELKVNRSISATEHYEEYAVTIFDQLVQDCRDIIEGAESYAVRAETAAVNAEAYSESASASAEAASASATTASTASTTATTAAETATAASVSASTSAETATTAAASASASATTATSASESAVNASTSAQASATTAVNASNTATSAATSAENSATTATTAANNASASATSAAADATNAAISEANASTSATNAHTSETSASNSATSASTSATNAANSATSAATSATNAHNSEVNASTSETNASTSAAEAEASAESIAASVAQINENTYRINDLEAIIGGYQLTDLPTGAVATITDGTALLMPSLKVGIEPVQSGSGDPSPENIRPISGWTAANVTRTGKNLYFDKLENASITANGTFENNSSNTVYIARVKENEEYTFTTNESGVTVGGYFTEKPTLSSTTYNGARLYIGTNTPQTVTIPQGVKYIAIRYLKTFTTPVIEYGSTATTYEPYNGTTYNIQFTDGDNPLTVYGGTLDVVSGVLTVDRAMVDLGEMTWRKSKDDVFWYSNDLERIAKTYPNNVPNKVIFEKYESKPSRAGGYYPNEPNTISLNANSVLYATSETAPTGQCVYELATPTTYHLSPTQVRTLVGTNNIWADTGNIIEGKYYKSLT